MEARLFDTHDYGGTKVKVILQGQVLRLHFLKTNQICVSQTHLVLICILSLKEISVVIAEILQNVSFYRQ